MQQPERALLDDAPGAALYERFAPALFAYFLKQTASREDAEDLLLEVFLAALEQERLAPANEAKQAAWLWAVARHKAADYFRQRGRSHQVDLEQAADALADVEQREPEQQVMQQEERAQLAAAVKRLPTKQQDVVNLRFAHELSYSEIASILNKREGTIRMLLFRALRTLRNACRQLEM